MKLLTCWCRTTRWPSMAKEEKGKRSEQRKARQREKQERQGERVCTRRQRSQVGKYFTVTSDKPPVAHMKESSTLMDNYLDSICLISPKWHSITRELKSSIIGVEFQKQSPGNMQMLLLDAQVGPRRARLLALARGERPGLHCVFRKQLGQLQVCGKQLGIREKRGKLSCARSYI